MGLEVVVAGPAGEVVEVVSIGMRVFAVVVGRGCMLGYRVGDWSLSMVVEAVEVGLDSGDSVAGIVAGRREFGQPVRT